jgi:hypothetical protein
MKLLAAILFFLFLFLEQSGYRVSHKEREYIPGPNDRARCDSAFSSSET